MSDPLETKPESGAEGSATVDDAKPIGEAARGRRHAIAIAACLGGAWAAPLALGALDPRGAAFPLLIFGALLLQLFRGRAWARWVLTAITGVAAALAVVQTKLALDEGAVWSMPMLFSVVYTWAAATLAFSRPLTTYQRFRRDAAG